MMKKPTLSFYGGIGSNNLTASTYVFRSSGGYNLGLEIGGYQGYEYPIDSNNTTQIPKDKMPQSVVITHSHYDHGGRAPILIKEGFKGKFLLTEWTKKTLEITLLDSYNIMKKAYGGTIHHLMQQTIQKDMFRALEYILEYEKNGERHEYKSNEEIYDEIDKIVHKKKCNLNPDHIREVSDPENTYNKYKKFLNDNKISSYDDIKKFKYAGNLPWTLEDLQEVINKSLPLNYDTPYQLSEELAISIHDAKHILGSAQACIYDKNFGKTVFSGDLGRIRDRLYFDKPHLFTQDDNVNTLIMETTYGANNHKNRSEEDKILIPLIHNNKGNVLFPGFGNHKITDDLQRCLSSYEGSNNLPPIILDGYTATMHTHLRVSLSEYTTIRENMQKIIWGKDISYEDKINLLRSHNKSIIFSTSGMMDAGPSRNIYLHKVLQDPDGLLIVPGFVAPNTTGHDIVTKGEYKYGGTVHKVKAKVYHCKSRSSHADMDDIHEYLSSMRPEHTILVHGNEDQKQQLKEWIKSNNISKKVTIPREIGQEIEL